MVELDEGSRVGGDQGSYGEGKAGEVMVGELL